MEFVRQEYWSWVAISFFRGSSQPRNQTRVSHIAGRCFTVWTTREALVENPGRNTGVSCHFLQCMKVKSESEVTESCPTLSDPMDCSLPGSSVHGIFQARVLEWGAIAFSIFLHRLSLLKITTLEIKTDQLKIFIYEHLKATICSWHLSINNVYLVKNCYFFQNENLEEEWHIWYFGRALYFSDWILICFCTQPAVVYCFGWSGWRKSGLTWIGS